MTPLAWRVARNGRFSAVTIWVLVAGGVILWQQLYREPATIVTRAWHLHTDTPQDFFQEWASARNLREGLPLYGSLVDSLRRYRSDVGLALRSRPLESALGITQYGHPPVTALLVYPLGFLRYVTAFRVWNILQFVSLGLSVWVIGKQLEFSRPILFFAVAVAILFMSYPLQYQSQQGQLSILLLLLLTGTWASARTRHDAAAGLCLAGAILVKVFPGFVVLYFVIQRRWKVVTWAAAGVIGTVLATTVLLGGWRVYLDFYHALPSVSAWRSAWGNASVPGLWGKLFDPGTSGEPVHPLVPSPHIAFVLTAVTWFLVAGVTMIGAARARTESSQDGAFALAIVAMLLLSPLTWGHAFLLLVLPIAWLWKRWEARTLLPSLLLVVVVTLCLNPSAAWYWRISAPNVVAAAATPLQSVTWLSVQCYALLSLFGLVWAGLNTPSFPGATFAEATAGSTTRGIPVHSSIS